MDGTPPRNGGLRLRIRLGIVLMVLGLLIFVLGANPAIYGLDRSPVTGFVQISVFLVGLALVCIAGYITLSALWTGREKTILADIGLRLVSTGYVICVATAMADVFGFGTHTLPKIPYFGPYQAIGTMIGEGIIIAGFLMLIPYPE
jgi:hypothetical protein